MVFCRLFSAAIPPLPSAAKDEGCSMLMWGSQREIDSHTSTIYPEKQKHVSFLFLYSFSFRIRKIENPPINCLHITFSSHLTSTTWRTIRMNTVYDVKCICLMFCLECGKIYCLTNKFKFC